MNRINETTGGWTCINCGEWVIWGIEHVCPLNSPSPPICNTYNSYTNVNHEILRKLDELLNGFDDFLEKGDKQDGG